MNLYISKPGVLCAAGASIETLWKSVTEGNQSGIEKTEISTGKAFYAARIKDGLSEPSSARYDMRIMRIEEAALKQIETDIERAKTLYGEDRIAVCVGSCDNGTEASVAAHRAYFKTGSFPKNYALEVQGADYVSTFIAERCKLRGSVNTFSTACSSSAGALIKGAELILAGFADAVVTGGVDIVSDTVLMGFDSLGAVSPEITNPFSKNRSGITLGEGAAFFVLSKDRLDSSSVPVKLLGWGESADAYHMTSPDPSGAGAALAMKHALESASLTPDQIDYINLHGTGTHFNDAMEGTAVHSVFSPYNVPVSSTKPVTGHTLGAAAAIELSICYAALVENIGKSGNNICLPVQIWDEETDSEIPPVRIIDRNNPANPGRNVSVCMSNSFAFGGANNSLIIGL